MKKEETSKEDSRESLLDYLKRMLYDVFIDNIPADAIKELPTTWMYICGVLIELGALTLFIFFLLQGYQQGIHQQFISLSKNSGVCEDVIKPLTGSFVADLNGSWSGSSAYVSSKGVYQMQVSNIKFTDKSYRDFMYMAEQQIDRLAEFSITNDFSLNLMIFTSWQLVCDPTLYSGCDEWGSNRFTLIGSAVNVFATSHVFFSSSNVFADCTTSPTTTYDLGSASQVATYSYTDFSTNPSCNTIVDPELLDYNSVLNGDSLGIEFDVRTLVDAVAVNFGILYITKLVEVYNTERITIVFKGVEYTGTYYIDDFYPSMDPMFCVITTNNGNDLPAGYSKELCLITIDNIMGMPLFMQWGAGGYYGNPEGPLPCDW
jgi:hypothetical protein